MNEETGTVFPPGSMVSSRNPLKISSLLVRAKLYLLDRVVGSTKCGEVSIKVSEKGIFTSNVTGGTCKINHN